MSFHSSLDPLLQRNTPGSGPAASSLSQLPSSTAAALSTASANTTMSSNAPQSLPLKSSGSPKSPFSSTVTSGAAASGSNASTAGGSKKKPRGSSFNSPSSPWARRRSFLSPAMINDEKHSVYELASTYVYDEQVIDDDENEEGDERDASHSENKIENNDHENDHDGDEEAEEDNGDDDGDDDDIYMSRSGVGRASSMDSSYMTTTLSGKKIRRRSQRVLSFLLSLKESQGFSWNQDLFASEYQQAHALTNGGQSQNHNGGARHYSNGSDPYRSYRTGYSGYRRSYGGYGARHDDNQEGEEEVKVFIDNRKNRALKGDPLNDSKFKIIHKKRRKSANNEREGYNCVEVSEIILDDSDL